LKDTRFETEKATLHARLSRRMQKALCDLKSQDKLVRDMEASSSSKKVKEPPYK